MGRDHSVPVIPVIHKIGNLPGYGIVKWILFWMNLSKLGVSVDVMRTFGFCMINIHCHCLNCLDCWVSTKMKRIMFHCTIPKTSNLSSLSGIVCYIWANEMRHSDMFKVENIHGNFFFSRTKWCSEASHSSKFAFLDSIS